jgi:regulator of protease activity HflC (stomatin/prohibitin superfamily)
MRLFLVILGIVLIAAGLLVWLQLDKPLAAWLMVPLGIICLFSVFCIRIVPTGYLGINSKYQQIQGEPLKPNQYWQFPFTNQIDLINCKQQEKDLGTTTFECESSERQIVYVSGVVVDYSINPEYAVWIWQNVEEYDTQLLKQRTVEMGIKAATVQFNDQDVTKRNLICPVAKKEVQAAFDEKYGTSVLIIHSITLGQIGFKPEYEEAMDERALAKVNAEKQEYLNQEANKKAEGEAQKTKIQLEAAQEQARIKAETARINAQSKADVKLIEAKAEAEANKELAASLTPELIEMMRAENDAAYISKWDGHEAVIQGEGTTSIVSGDAISAIYQYRMAEEEAKKAEKK